MAAVDGAAGLLVVGLKILVRKGLLSNNKISAQKELGRKLIENKCNSNDFKSYHMSLLINTWKAIPVNTKFTLPRSGRRSTAVTGAADKFREVANLRMEGRSSMYG